MRIQVKSDLPLATIRMLEVIVTNLYGEQEIGRKSELEEDAQFSGFFFLSKY